MFFYLFCCCCLRAFRDFRVGSERDLIEYRWGGAIGRGGSEDLGCGKRFFYCIFFARVGGSEGFVFVLVTVFVFFVR